MALSYIVMFNSGSGDAQFLYNRGDNVEFININNSDQSYYQTADLSLFNIGSANEGNLDINTPIRVWINDSLEFDGYVNRIQKSLMGKKRFNLQCVGRTYDLWRFITSSNESFSNKYTSFIVSSLISDYCSGNSTYVAPPNIGLSGVVIDTVTFDSMTIGDCIARMSQIDGYTFYVDTNKTLQYYEPATTSQFTVIESDILDMIPVEDSDDDMKNDVTIIGSLQYESYSRKDNIDDITDYLKVSGAGNYIAQSIKVPTSLHQNWLSAIKLYLSRTSGTIKRGGITTTKIPLYLRGDVRKHNTETDTPSSNYLISSDTLNYSVSNIPYPPDWLPYYSYQSPESFPITGGQRIWLSFNYDGAYSGAYWDFAYGEFETPIYGINNLIDFNPNFTGTWDYGGKNYGDVGYDSTNQHIYFCASSIGYAAANDFDNDGSRRYRDFGITGGGVTDDQMYFLVSANIKSYVSGSYLGSPKKETYSKYNAKLMIGIYDPTSPNGYDYNPMMGFEFNFYKPLYIYSEDFESGSYDSSMWIDIYGSLETTSTSPITGVYSGKLVCANEGGLWQCDQRHKNLNVLTDYEVKVKINIKNGAPTNDYCAIRPFVGDSVIIEVFFRDEGHPSYPGKITIYDNGGDNDTGITWAVNTVYTIRFKPNPDNNQMTVTINGTDYGPYDGKSSFNKINKMEYEVTNEVAANDDRWMMIDDIRADSRHHIELPSQYKKVRPFLSNDITNSNPGNPQYRYGDWQATGSNAYKCQIDGTNFNFYVDGLLKQNWDITNITLDGGYKFGIGHIYDWSGFRIQLIDTASGNAGDTFSGATLSGNITYLKIVGSEDECIATSTDSGATWTKDSDKYLIYDIGWNYDNVRGSYSDIDSVAKYGKHFYKTSEPLFTTYQDCDNYAERLVDTYKSGITKGEVSIIGRTGINLGQKFTFNASNLGVNELFIIAQYNQLIDKEGFKSVIYYGGVPYDIARKVSQLEGEVYGG